MAVAGVSALVGAVTAACSVFVTTTEVAAVAAAHSVDPDRWQSEFSAVLDRIAPRFCRYEPLRHAGELMAGMVSGLDRKNCWTIAEHRGAVTPDGLQRQYSGTAGRVENSQVAVYLTYAAPRGHALIDRALYLPKSWSEDSDRCSEARIPTDKRGFATKPALATTLIDRAVAAKVPAAWVAGDEVYGADPRLRAAVRGHRLGYVLAVAANRRVPTHAGPIRVDALPALIPPHAWQKHSAGAGAHGPRLYSWAWFRLLAEDDTDNGHHHLLIRRNDVTGELAYLRCYSPRAVPLATLVAVAGQRWRIEESFQAAKGLVGLDQHQVRRWRSWHRWTTLAMLAHAFLAVACAVERDITPTPAGLIALTVNEFRRLFDALLLATNYTVATLLAWSRWRRRHQYRARLSHYRRRENQ